MRRLHSHQHSLVPGTAHSASHTVRVPSSGWDNPKKHRHKAGPKAIPLQPAEVLDLAKQVISSEPCFAKNGIEPITLACIALIESGGRKDAKQYREHCGGTSIGVCQVRRQ